MVRVLFNTDDHHSHGHAHSNGSSTAGGPSSRVGVVDDSSVLGSHRCRVYDMHSLLTEARWLGTRALTLELTSSSRGSMALFCSRLRSALKGVVEARIRVLSPCTLRLSRIDIRSAAVDANQLLPLAEHILCVDVEKEPNWRIPTLIPGAAPSSAPSASPGAVAAAAALAPPAPAPSDPRSVTGPTHPSGAALCCSVLTSRGDIVSALSTEIASCASTHAHLLQALKHAEEHSSSAAAQEGANKALPPHREQVEAEVSEARLNMEQDVADAAEASMAGHGGGDSGADAAKKTCASLSARVRTQFQRVEAHRLRLVHILKADIALVSCVHVCNVCQRVLRVEGTKEPKGAAGGGVASNAASSAAAAQQLVSEGELAARFTELSLGLARGTGAAGSSTTAARAGASAAAAAAASAAAAAAASSSSSSNAATAALSTAHFAVPSSSTPQSSPVLSSAQARARLAELQSKLSSATGAEAKARRKKISKKISELRARYAEAFVEDQDVPQQQDGDDL